MMSKSKTLIALEGGKNDLDSFKFKVVQIVQHIMQNQNFGTLPCQPSKLKHLWKFDCTLRKITVKHTREQILAGPIT